MSNPSFENIDQWLFEYTEGSLSPTQESQLLDFIGSHPELLQELKIWKSAKATAMATETPSTASMIKPAFFLFQPKILLVSIGILALLLGWIGFSYIPDQQQYTMSRVDTEIININHINGGVFNTEKIASHQMTGKEGGINQRNQEHSLNETKGFVNNKNTAKPNYQKGTDKTGATNLNVKQNTKTALNKINDSTISNSIENNLSTIDYSELNLVQSKFKSTTQDLGTIISYLNGDRNTYRDQESSSKGTKTLSVASKSSSKNTLHQFMRKFRRIMNQPTALRNTKTPHYHAPMMTGFKANPAMAGATSGNRIQATSRIQWLNQSNAQLMNTLSWDGYVNSLRGGVGIDLNYDGYNINSLNNYSVGLTYSPKLTINKNISIEPAIRFKMGVVSIDQSSPLIGNKIEMSRNNITPLFVNEEQLNASQMWYRDIGLGFMFNTKWFYAGFNADNLGRHDNNFYSSNLDEGHRANIYYTAVLGTEYEAITRDMSVSIYGLFQNYGDLKEFWLGSNFQYKWMQFGAGINTKADFGASAGIVLNRVTFHYNVDYTQSRLLNGKYLSHQISLGILLKPNKIATKYMNL